MAFKVGQKVTCIEYFKGEIVSGPNKGRKNSIIPIKGEIYTIHSFSQCTGNLILKEMVFNSFGCVCAHNKNKFRPLDYGFVEKVLSNIKEESFETNKI